MEIPAEHKQAAQKIAQNYGVDWIELGKTDKNPVVKFSENSESILSGALADFAHIWLNGLRDKL